MTDLAQPVGFREQITLDPRVKSHHVPESFWLAVMAQMCECGVRYGLHESGPQGMQGLTSTGCPTFRLKESHGTTT